MDDYNEKGLQHDHHIHTPAYIKQMDGAFGVTWLAGQMRPTKASLNYLQVL